MGKLYDALPDNFLKKVLEGANIKIIENFLVNQEKFTTAVDKEDKAVYKVRLTSAFWQLYSDIAKKITPQMSKTKRLFIRYGILDLKYLSTEHQKMVLRQEFEAQDKEKTIYYVDEWLLAIARGEIKPSITDEAPKRRKPPGGGPDKSVAQQKYERISGSMEAERMNYKKLVGERKNLEESILSISNLISNHSNDPLLEMPSTYNESQIEQLDKMGDIIRNLKKINKDMKIAENAYTSRFEECRELETELEIAGAGEQQLYDVDSQAIENEINAIRQMVKMCVGRQGNHFPILASAYLPKEADTENLNFKQTVDKKIGEVEKLDPSVFARTWKRQSNRISPYIILMPGYGNLGICWEPYDKYNKATSKGRIAIPIFTRSPILTISMAMGDFRWQTAKELASYHWMEEGLTGRYYEYINENKLKGDMKTMFVEDYILWLTKESQGVQKLHKDVRYLFWRFVPFPDDKKEELSMRGYYYEQLWKKEQVSRMSDGY